ncbi:MAG: arsinothricin resistance N-acetyltransferase ArsN1 family A, partial [Chloroflexota bacterium]
QTTHRRHAPPHGLVTRRERLLWIGLLPMNPTTRPARPEDAPAIARVYSQGIADRVATFETEPRDAAQILTALAERGDRYPTMVAEREGRVIAAAWASLYRSRPCYAGIAEFSVYTERTARGSGAGRAVMEALIAACEERGFWKLVSRVFIENAASRALCARLGFREVGVYRRHAQLDGLWRDVMIVELLIGPARDG